MNDRFEETHAGPAVLEVDRLLSEFYQAAMPHPWPRLNVPAARAARRPAPSFSRNFRRLALAASVVLALVIYWGLAGLLPQNGAGGLPGALPEIGQKQGHREPVKHLVPLERQRTPAGNDAQVFEEDTPGGTVINVIGPSNTKGPR
jgi:hypothetical protein